MISASLKEEQAKRLDDFLAATGRSRSEAVSSALELLYRAEPAGQQETKSMIAGIAAQLKES